MSRNTSFLKSTPAPMGDPNAKPFGVSLRVEKETYKRFKDYCNDKGIIKDSMVEALMVALFSEVPLDRDQLIADASSRSASRRKLGQLRTALAYQKKIPPTFI
jgi:hypothetical protein